MKVYVSKYALANGIQEMDDMELFVYDNGARKYVANHKHYLLLGKGAHETREAAVAAAEEMRQEKIASLRKQLARLESLTF